MFEAIEKLKETKEKLTVEFEENRQEYKSEIKKIDTAIRKFSQGYTALGNILLDPPRKRGIANEIELILADGKAKHINEILEELDKRGFNAKYQSVSAILQVYAKSGKRFIKILPATYMRIFGSLTIEGQNDQNTAFDDDFVILDEDLDEPF